jgi:hypothetical protein
LFSELSKFDEEISFNESIKITLKHGNETPENISESFEFRYIRIEIQPVTIFETYSDFPKSILNYRNPKILMIVVADTKSRVIKKIDNLFFF